MKSKSSKLAQKKTDSRKRKIRIGEVNSNEWEKAYSELLFGIINLFNLKKELEDKDRIHVGEGVIEKWKRAGRRGGRFPLQENHRSICNMLNIELPKSRCPEERIKMFTNKFIEDNRILLRDKIKTFSSDEKTSDYLVYLLETFYYYRTSSKQAESNGISTNFVLIGPPGIGKTTLVKKLSEKLKKKVLSTDIFFNDRIFDNQKRFLNEGGYTLEEFIQIKSMTDIDKSEDDYYPLDIRELCYEIVIRMAVVTGDLIDLDGKAILFPDVIKFLRSKGFKLILIIPNLDGAECGNKSKEEKKKEEFNEYFLMYKNYGKKLFSDNLYRENIREMMQKALCKNFEKIKLDPKLKTSRCDDCSMDPNFICEHKVESEELWETFKDKLYNEIWLDRYDKFHNNYDLIIDRRSRTPVEETVETLMQKLKCSDKKYKV
jgi:shikimate kinase